MHDYCICLKHYLYKQSLLTKLDKYFKQIQRRILENVSGFNSPDGPGTLRPKKGQPGTNSHTRNLNGFRLFNYSFITYWKSPKFRGRESPEKWDLFELVEDDLFTNTETRLFQSRLKSDITLRICNKLNF